jgi:hypothetical protein
VTLAAFRHEEQVTLGDDTYRLAMNFRALDAIESETKRSFDGILRELTTPGAEPPMSLQGKVVWGLLREHHPEVTLDQSITLILGPAGVQIGMAMGSLFETAFPRAEAPKPGKDKPAHPRKPRGASKPTSSPGAENA